MERVPYCILNLIFANVVNSRKKCHFLFCQRVCSPYKDTMWCKWSITVKTLSIVIKESSELDVNTSEATVETIVVKLSKAIGLINKCNQVRLSRVSHQSIRSCECVLDISPEWFWEIIYWGQLTINLERKHLRSALFLRLRWQGLIWQDAGPR